MQGTTASGAPYYKADGALYWIYWDPDCGGTSGLTGWLLDGDAPSTTAASDLDGDGECRLIAYHVSDVSFLAFTGPFHVASMVRFSLGEHGPT